MMFFSILFMLSILIFSILCYSKNYILSTAFLGISGINWQFLFCLDYVTVGILLMLCICFSYAYFYTGHYFSGDSAGSKLNIIISLFVSVMATLVLTGDVLMTLVFWEYLGVVSFFLILFYLKYLSLRSAAMTLISSRFGDVCLFLLMASLGYSNWQAGLVGLLFYFIVFTKSAGYPFISWLLEAMRAPTPVSSLVHSSTLVAAGVWFAMRYDMFLMMDNSFWFIFLLLMTIFITGSCCFFFMDLKKMVALSTCNKISWCVMFLMLGDVTLSLFQLVSHGVSKCILFMLVGDVMSGSGGSQASNCVYSPRLYGNWGLFGLFSVVLGLSGAPFMGVFFTKHFMLTTFLPSYNLMLSYFILFCVFLSYFYSFRLCSILYKVKNSMSTGVFFGYCSGLMASFWLMVNFYMGSLLDETTVVSSGTSLFLMVFQVVSVYTAWSFYKSTLFSRWCSSMFGCDNLVEYCYKMGSRLVNQSLLFFFRWDKTLMKMFNGLGSPAINIIKYNLLKMTMIGCFFVFMCFYMLY